MYVEYISEKQNKYLTKNRAYHVLQVIENYYYLIKDDNNKESIYEPHLFKIFPLLRVKYIGNNNNIHSLIKNKIYDVLSIRSFSVKDDTYQIIDESEEDYLYSKIDFEIIEDNTSEVR